MGPCTSYSVEVAAWVPFTSGGASDRGAFPRLKTAARGLWLRASEEALLTLEARPPGSSGAAPAVLRVCLKGRRQLAACPVARRALHCTALCPEHAGRGCWVLLLHMQAGRKVGGPRCRLGCAMRPLPVAVHPPLGTCPEQQLLTAPAHHPPQDTTLAIRFLESQWHAGQQCAALIQASRAGLVAAACASCQGHGY